MHIPFYLFICHTPQTMPYYHTTCKHKFKHLVNSPLLLPYPGLVCIAISTRDCFTWSILRLCYKNLLSCLTWYSLRHRCRSCDVDVYIGACLLPDTLLSALYTVVIFYDGLYSDGRNKILQDPIPRQRTINCWLAGEGEFASAREWAAPFCPMPSGQPGNHICK